MGGQGAFLTFPLALAARQLAKTNFAEHFAKPPSSRPLIVARPPKLAAARLPAPSSLLPPNTHPALVACEKGNRAPTKFATHPIRACYYAHHAVESEATGIAVAASRLC